MSTPAPVTGVNDFIKQVGPIRESLQKIVLHQPEAIDSLLTCCLCDGHALLVGVPALPKTLLLKSLTSLLPWKCQRIQFPPALLPADITGYELLAGAGGAQ